MRKWSAYYVTQENSAGFPKEDRATLVELDISSDGQWRKRRKELDDSPSKREPRRLSSDGESHPRCDDIDQSSFM